MEIKTLLETRPLIKSFSRTLAGVVDKGIYEKKETGRPHDALIYIIKGSSSYDFGDYSFDVKVGDLLFLAKGSKYTMHVHERYAYLFANFDFAVPSGVALKCAGFPAPSGKQVEALFQKMLATWRARHSNSAEQCLGYLYMVYADFLSANEAAYFPTIKKKRIADAIAYIDEHLTEKSLNIAEIAAHIHLSESYFRHSFKDMHKMSPVQYIQMRRIVLAKEQIRYTEKKFSVIAEELGFSSLYYFSYAFKKETGYTPSEYRSKYTPYL